MLNNISIMGRLTADPELKTVGESIPLCRFCIAVDRFSKEKKTDFFNVVAWRSTAEFIAKHFTKGQPIALAGELRSDVYTDDKDIKHYRVEILVSKAYFAGNAPLNATEAEFEKFAETELEEIE